MHILPRPLPSEVLKREHFDLVDLQKSLPRGSSQVEASPEPLVLPDHLPLVVQDPKPIPQAVKKKKKKKKIGQAKAIGAGLERFVDWTNSGVSESAEEEEAKMSSLVSGFSTRMCKRAASAHGETAPSFEVPKEKRPKLSGPNEEAQKSLTVINVDSPD